MRKIFNIHYSHVFNALFNFESLFKFLIAVGHVICHIVRFARRMSI